MKHAHALCLALTLAAPSLALDGVVEKREVLLEDFALGGETVDLRIGVETYGTLAPTGDNVVLLAPFLAGHSHAAGKLSADDPAPGWWDALIGPGAPIDTDRWFVVSTDAIALPRSKPASVITTGPSSPNAQGVPYGPDFPRFGFADQVRAQRAVLEHLGVTHLRAVAGASMGGMIAWTWAVTQPDFVDLVIPVAAPVSYTAAERGGLAFARSLIEADPHWQGGRYHGGTEPNLGVGLVLMLLNGVIGPKSPTPPQPIDWTQVEAAYQALLDSLPASPADVAAQLTQVPTVQTYMERAEAEFDGGHFVQTFHAFEAYGAESGLRAGLPVRPVVIGFADDQLVGPAHLGQVESRLTRLGLAHRVEVLPGGRGHLSCLLDTDQFAEILRAELEGTGATPAPQPGMIGGLRTTR